MRTAARADDNPSNMPEYTLEQKAAAFDALWRSCGRGAGGLLDFVSLDISRTGCPQNEAVFMRVPRYKFSIVFEGEARKFADVLHHLATRS